MIKLQRRGFTLIELMVAMTIMGIIIVGVYAFATGISHNFSRETEASQNTLNISIAEQLIQRDLQRLGFRASMDSVFDPLVRVSGGSDFVALALSVVPKNGVVPQHHMAKIVADLSDYDSFVVSSLSGNTLSFEPVLQLPPDPESLKNGAFVREPASESEFKMAFRKAFGNARALRISSSAGKSVIVSINAVDVDDMSITINGYSYQSEDGFQDSTLAHAHANPVMGVKYDLVEYNAEPSLRRCTFDPLGVSAKENCVIILERVYYLGFLPIKHQNNLSEISTLLISNSQELVTDWHSKTASFTLAELSSVFYRFSLASPKEQRYIKVQQAALDARIAPPYLLDASNKAYLLNHSQGSAIVYSQTPPETQSSLIWQ
ncbi:MAG: prepilin-type N-terminal cleavage/methylation domain-containing protein [Bradymonadales bacterium]|jgi:prepilin-type N-terminal cleavage/methylation domain-containing protein